MLGSLDRRYGPDLGMAYVSIGEISRQSNQLDQAETYLSKGIELCRPFDARVVSVVVGLISLAWLRQAQGDDRAALSLLEEAAQIDPGHFPYAAARVAANQAKLCLALGDFDAAARWADEVGLGVEDELSYLREIDYLTYVRVLIAQGKLDQALQLLARIRHTAETGHRMGRVIEVQNLQALAYKAQGDLPRALASLGRALALAEPEGYVRVFADEGEPMADLLRKAGARSIESDFFVQLMKSFEPIRDEPALS
jgi:LuxR family maltose regulon positive regulatory protein